ncbi:putative nucleosome assembly protein (naP), partial [Cardiosporidium cionae]
MNCSVQSELQKLDEDCAREQMIIQNKFDEKKKPWFEKRQGIIDSIPGFWCRTLRRHPILAYIIPEDIEILNFLRRIDLEDNIDDSGSYKISFSFSDKAKEFLEPLTIVKHVKFESDKEQVEECTEIKWKSGKNPIEKALERRKADENCDDWSIFEWFTKQSEDDRNEDRIDIGEVIRRDIWHSPLPHFLGTAGAD